MWRMEDRSRTSGGREIDGHAVVFGLDWWEVLVEFGTGHQHTGHFGAANMG
jgi:hypothetical protein